MERHDWLMLLLAFKGAAPDGDPSLDPIRVQKGMFLFAQRGGLPPAERYDFVPHNYGPYSTVLKADLERLVREGYASKKPVPGYTWGSYRLTHAGMERAHQLLEEAPREQARQAFDIKQEVTSVSFNDLLRDVYADYPAFATRSVFRT